MLKSPKSTRNDSKCEVTHGTMGYVDPKQPPTRRKPFAPLLEHRFVQEVSIILPEELFEIVKTEIVEKLIPMRYSRVIMSLEGIVEGEFFNEYIKKGNILMLSEGKIGADNVFMLKEGLLTMYLDKESYEKAGLDGRPDGIKGKRGTKPRWVVEIQLRSPSMLHGKKGFDRIVHAFKNVLKNPVTWLFLNMGEEVKPDPLDAYFPIRKTATLSISRVFKANVPSLKPAADIDPTYGADFEDFTVELYEWISMALLESPRIDPDDKIDPFLCRYSPPGDLYDLRSLKKITWRGFMSSIWIQKIFIELLQVLPRDVWFAYNIADISTDMLSEGNCTMVLKLPDGHNEYILWEIS